MTNEVDDFHDRIRDLGKGFNETVGLVKNAFASPSGQFPRSAYVYQSSINKAARGASSHELSVGGATSGVNLDVGPGATSQYGLVDVRETVSGHVLEFNDTPGGERVLIKHKSGSGVELRPDGSVLVVTSRNRVDVTHGDNQVIVEGDADLTYKGNLNLKVSGDFNVECNNYSVTAKGNKDESIAGEAKHVVFGNSGTTISGSHNQTVAGSSVGVALGGTTIATKGALTIATEGPVNNVSSGNHFITSETQLNLSANDTNVAAKDLSVFGHTGTIGGQSVVHYGPTFHGDLNGTARFARRLGSGGSLKVFSSNNELLNEVGGGDGEDSDNTITNTKTAMPTLNVANSYLEASDRGIRKVKIDVDDMLKNKMLVRNMSTADVRSKMREKSIRDNAEFTAHQISKGKLSTGYANGAPGSYGRVRTTSSANAQRGVNPLGEVSGVTKVRQYKTNRSKFTYDVIPEGQYLSNMEGIVTTSTRINYATSLGKFVGGNDTGDFNKLNLQDKQQIAKNLFIHSELMKTVSSSGPHPTAFEEFRLEVVEGFYAKELYGIGGPGKLTAETLEPNGILDLRTKGRAVVYELVGADGKVDFEATFDLCKAWAEVGYFDKLTLDFDTYNPDGSLNAQIIVETPNVTDFSNIRFKRVVATSFNNNIQGDDILLEIKL